MGFRKSKVMARTMVITKEDLEMANIKLFKCFRDLYPEGLIDIARENSMPAALGYVAEAVVARVFFDYSALVMKVCDVEFDNIIGVGKDIEHGGYKYDVKFGKGSLTEKSLNRNDVDFFIFCTSAFSVPLDEFITNPDVLINKSLTYLGYLPFSEAKVGINKPITEPFPIKDEYSHSSFKESFNDLLKQDAVLANDLHMAISELEFGERLAADTIELKEKYGEANVEKTNDHIKIRINVDLDSRFSLENGIIQKVEKEVQDKLDSDIEEATGRNISDFNLSVETQGNVIVYTYCLRGLQSHLS